MEPELVQGEIPDNAVPGVAGDKRHAAARLVAAVLDLHREVLARLARGGTGKAMRLKEPAAPVCAVCERKIESALEVLPSRGGRVECASPDIVYGVPVVHQPVLDIGGRGHCGSRRLGVDRERVGDDAPVRANAGNNRLASSYRGIALVGNGVVDVLHQQRGAGVVRDDDRRLERGAGVELVGNPRDGDVRLVRPCDERPRADILEEGVGHEIPEPDDAAAEDGNEIADQLAVLPDLERVEGEL